MGLARSRGASPGTILRGRAAGFNTWGWRGQWLAWIGEASPSSRRVCAVTRIRSTSHERRRVLFGKRHVDARSPLDCSTVILNADADAYSILYGEAAAVDRLTYPLPSGRRQRGTLLGPESARSCVCVCVCVTRPRVAGRAAGGRYCDDGFVQSGRGS